MLISQKTGNQSVFICSRFNASRPNSDKNPLLWSTLLWLQRAQVSLKLGSRDLDGFHSVDPLVRGRPPYTTNTKFYHMKLDTLRYHTARNRNIFHLRLVRYRVVTDTKAARQTELR